MHKGAKIKVYKTITPGSGSGLLKGGGDHEEKELLERVGESCRR